MRATLIIASLFAALAAAAPVDVETDNTAAIEAVEIEARQANTVTVQLSNPTTAVQSNIVKGRRITINSQVKFRNLGRQIPADRANIVGAGGPCSIFSDANARTLVATIKKGGAEAKFGRNVNLVNGVIVCQ